VNWRPILEHLIELALFLAKAVIIVTALIFMIGSILSAAHRQKPSDEGMIVVRDISSKFKDLHDDMLLEIMNEKDYKAHQKELKKKDKEKQKEKKKNDKALKKAKKQASKNQDTTLMESKNEIKNNESTTKETTDTEVVDTENRASSDDTIALEPKGRIFVLDFDGGEDAHEVDCLREEVSAILTIATPEDEVLLRLESPGGVVHGYGHAASQLQRIKDKNIKLVASIDEVAASGGYMMACVADVIRCAPFAIVGSIGVIAELPNFNRLLKKLDVDIEQHTAGEFKRTLTMLGPNTDKGREKFREELNEAHDLFKHWVSTHRQQVDIDKVATGEHWFGTQAIDLKLVDELGTSDDYLMSHSEKQAVFQITFEKPKQLTSRLTRILQGSIEGLIGSGIKQLKRSRFNWHQ